jgi:hypothetical protein
MEGYTAISDRLWYCNSDGTPWSTNRPGPRSHEGPPKKLTARNQDGYYSVGVNGRTRPWHRLVYEHFNGPIPRGIQVDHIDGNPGNNLISNLRLATNAENQRNTGKYSNNTSGARGVYFHRRNQKWVAHIRFNGILKHLGCYHSLDDASLAYETAAKEYFGSFYRDAS